LGGVDFGEAIGALRGSPVGDTVALMAVEALIAIQEAETRLAYAKSALEFVERLLSADQSRGNKSEPLVEERKANMGSSSE
jgi:hypothetical protein